MIPPTTSSDVLVGISTWNQRCVSPCGAMSIFAADENEDDGQPDL